MAHLFSGSIFPKLGPQGFGPTLITQSPHQPQVPAPHILGVISGLPVFSVVLLASNALATFSHKADSGLSFKCESSSISSLLSCPSLVASCCVVHSVFLEVCLNNIKMIYILVEKVPCLTFGPQPLTQCVSHDSCLVSILCTELWKPTLL